MNERDTSFCHCYERSKSLSLLSMVHISLVSTHRLGSRCQTRSMSYRGSTQEGSGTIQRRLCNRCDGRRIEVNDNKRRPKENTANLVPS
jgi:hypothetical protein